MNERIVETWATQEESFWSWPFVAICICNMLLFFAFQLILPTLPVYLDRIGLGSTHIGLISGLITIFAVLIRPVAGYVFDANKRAVVIVAGGAVFAAALASYMLSESLEWIIAVSAVVGIGWGIMTVAYTAIASEFIPAGRQGSGMGVFMIFALASTAVAPIVGGYLIEHYSRFGLFSVAFLIAFVSWVASTALFVRGKPERTVLSSRAGLSASGAAAVQGASDRIRFADRVIDRASLLPALLMLLFAICFGGVTAFANLHGSSIGVSQVGIFFFVSNVAAIMVRPIAGRWFDTKGHAAVILPGIIIGMAGLLVLSWATGRVSFLLASFLYGVSFGAVQPSLLAWTMGRAAPERRGAASSTFMIGMDSGIALGAFVLGIVTELSSISLMYRYSVVALVVFLVIYAVRLIRVRSARS